MRVLLLNILLLAACSAKQGAEDDFVIVGGGCDGCELMFIGMPECIDHIDTSVAWNNGMPKLLVEGTVFETDGETPAKGIVIYYWHTNEQGLYAPSIEQDERTKRHGAVRGWIKTNEQGRYQIFTSRPEVYPNRREPAHIHLSIKEPEIKNEYYIDALVFDDDSLLTEKVRVTKKNRGGSGIMKLKEQEKIFIAKHDIILGKNIPNYPVQN